MWKVNIKAYPCTECKLTASQAQNLKIHVESKHEGVRYPCCKCEYAATRASYLKVNIKNIHDGVIYLYSKCEFTATSAQNLKNHVESKQKVIHILNVSILRCKNKI